MTLEECDDYYLSLLKEEEIHNVHRDKFKEKRRNDRILRGWDDSAYPTE